MFTALLAGRSQGKRLSTMTTSELGQRSARHRRKFGAVWSLPPPHSSDDDDDDDDDEDELRRSV